jgi:hypothetical protein
MSSRRSEQRLLDLLLAVLGFLEEGRVLECEDGERLKVVAAGDRVEHFHRPMVQSVSDGDDGRTFRLEPHRTVTWMSEPQG